MLELEKQLEDPTDDTRVRFLEGKDMSPAELQNKLEEVWIEHNVIAEYPGTRNLLLLLDCVLENYDTKFISLLSILNSVVSTC